MSTHRTKRPTDTTDPGSLGIVAQWTMGLALGICALMIVGLLALILVQGVSSFWPGRIDQVTLASGEEVLGIPVRHRREPSGDTSTLYRVGNRDLGQAPFRWVADTDVEAVTQPSDAVLLERREWGIFIGRLNGSGADDAEADWDRFEEALEAGRARRAEIEALRAGEISQTNRMLSGVRQRLAEADLKLSESGTRGLPGWAWAVSLAVSIGGPFVAAWCARRSARAAAIVAGIVLLAGLAAWLERPVPGLEAQQARHAETTQHLSAEQASLEEAFVRLNAELATLEARDETFPVSVMSIDGRIAPRSQSDLSSPMLASQVVRAFRPNELSFAGRLGVFGSRWVEYLTTDPREANTEGGVLPVIVGTVTVTLLLTVAVVPLGVLAALYIREYATQGLLVSVLRVAINNLAGVPSIVYGIFGLGFFCYAVGGFIDGGAGDGGTLSRAAWWVLGVLAVSGGVSAVAFRVAGRWAFALWSVIGILAAALVVASPYFDGLFRVKLLDGQPTFGSSGLLWASLTLALLTLPVVIVATEEAIAAVPQSLREASYGCGASKWQTVSRVVLPGAMPGVMTGTILAMARGAGEVAPLMVVGAVKLAPELPLEPRFPFVFADRSFMHLGFHIYDLGFQSPDSEAARGMVWTTTLLLIVLVVTMNLGAVILRGRLRRRLVGGQF